MVRAAQGGTALCWQPDRQRERSTEIGFVSTGLVSPQPNPQRTEPIKEGVQTEIKLASAFPSASRPASAQMFCLSTTDYRRDTSAKYTTWSVCSNFGFSIKLPSTGQRRFLLARMLLCFGNCSFPNVFMYPCPNGFMFSEIKQMRVKIDSINCWLCSSYFEF